MKDVNANTEAKRLAGEAAAALVESGMLVGLGTGSTAAFAIAALGRRAQNEGLQIDCVATSFVSRTLGLEHGLRVLFLDQVSRIDISIDGADEIDSDRNLIKGGGAAHTLEKLVHSMSDRFVVVADLSKRVERLGEKFAVPVEVLPPALAFVRAALKEQGAESVELRVAVRKDGPVVTDNGNLVLDAKFGPFDAPALEDAIKRLPGVVESGIFARTRARPGDCILGNPGHASGFERF